MKNIIKMYKNTFIKKVKQKHNICKVLYEDNDSCIGVCLFSNNENFLLNKYKY